MDQGTSATKIGRRRDRRGRPGQRRSPACELDPYFVAPKVVWVQEQQAPSADVAITTTDVWLGALRRIVLGTGRSQVHIRDGCFPPGVHRRELAISCGSIALRSGWEHKADLPVRRSWCLRRSPLPLWQAVLPPSRAWRNLADAPGLGPGPLRGVWVQIPPPAPVRRGSWQPGAEAVADSGRAAHARPGGDGRHSGRVAWRHPTRRRWRESVRHGWSSQGQRCLLNAPGSAQATGAAGRGRCAPSNGGGCPVTVAVDRSAQSPCSSPRHETGHVLCGARAHETSSRPAQTSAE